jgi:hypothetical protein
MVTKKTKMGIGVAAAAAAAAGAAAGYYFYGSKNAKQNRVIAAKWAKDLKRDVLVQAKKVQKMDRATMTSIIDKAAAAYETMRSIDRRELDRAVRELKNNWTILTSEVGGRGAKKSAPKKRSAPKKAAKKSAKK